MKSICSKCNVSLGISQETYIRKNWTKNSGTFFDYEEFQITQPPSCAICGSKISIEVLSTIGLKNIYPNRVQAQGTKFYNAYRSSPGAYDKFSWSEDPEEKIASFIKKLCRKEYRLLDIGSGTGKYSIILSPFCSLYFALEPSPTLLNFSKQKVARTSLSNIVHLLGKGESIPLADESIDLIICTWSTFTLNDTLKEMMRVLKKKGIIIRVGARNRDELTSLFNNFDQKVLKDTNRWFEQQGFTKHETSISIKFSNTVEAKKILSSIVGEKANTIKTSHLRHNIIINTFQKI